MDASKGTRPPTGSLEDIEASRRFMERIKSEGNMETPSSKPPSPPENYQPVNPPSSPPPSGGQGGNHGSGDFSYHRTSDGKKRYLPAILIIFMMLVLFFFLNRSDVGQSKHIEVIQITPSQKEPTSFQGITKSALDLKLKAESLEREKISFEMEKARKELEQARKNLESSPIQQTQSPSQTKIINVFSCGEGQAEEKRQGFAAMDIQNMDRNGVSYQVPSGCAWIRINTKVQSLAGDGFLFAVKDSDSESGKTGCGTYDVLNGSNSIKECMKFLNDRQGQLIEVYVKGTVFVN